MSASIASNDVLPESYSVHPETSVGPLLDQTLSSPHSRPMLGHRSHRSGPQTFRLSHLIVPSIF